MSIYLIAMLFVSSSRQPLQERECSCVPTRLRGLFANRPLTQINFVYRARGLGTRL